MVAKTNYTSDGVLYYTRCMNRYVSGTKDRLKFDCNECKNQDFDDNGCGSFRTVDSRDRSVDTFGICANFNPFERTFIKDK